MLSGAAGQLYGSAITWKLQRGWESSLDTPGVVQLSYEKIEKLTGKRFYTRLGQRLPHRFLVVDDKPEMTTVVGSLPAAFLKREELIAEIDES